MTEQAEINKEEFQEYITLRKNKEGYTWGLRVHSDKISSIEIERLEAMDKELKEKWGEAEV